MSACVYRRAAGGGVSVLECVSANLTPVEVEVLAKALVESEFNVLCTLPLFMDPSQIAHSIASVVTA